MLDVEKGDEAIWESKGDADIQMPDGNMGHPVVQESSSTARNFFLFIS